MAFVRSGQGGGMTSLKDYYRDKVLNGGLTSICTLSDATRAKFNEGGVVADTTNRTCYLYVDMTILTDRVNPSDWSGLLTVTGMSTNYFPKTSTSSRSTSVPLITDESSSHILACVFGVVSSNSRFYASYGERLYANDHIIVYASWTY